MCGIFGVTFRKDNIFNRDFIKKITNKLFILSETRGKEAAGIAINNGRSINVYKAPIPASQLIQNKAYSSIFDDSFKDFSNFSNDINNNFPWCFYSFNCISYKVKSIRHNCRF